MKGSAIQLHLTDAMFNERIRRITHEETEYFSLIDIMAEFSNTKAAGQYWRDTKKRLEKDGFQPQDRILRLKLTAPDGKKRLTDCADGQTVLRIIQSVPSEKAEPLREWMATLGYRQLEEMRNPELAVRRREHELEKLYAAGYGDHPNVRLLQARHDGIAILQQLKARIAETCTESPRYGQIFNAEYFGLFGHVASELTIILQTKNIRDALSELELKYLQVAEISLRDVLANKRLTNGEITNAATRICRRLGENLAEISELTGTPLLTRPI